jgi:hypothetical protein
MKDRYLGWESFYAQAGDPKFTPPRPPAGDGVWSAGESFDGTYWQFVSWF